MTAILAGAQITVSQAVQFAKDAGFVGNAQTYIVAIAMAESSLYTHAVNTSDPYGGSFGVLQINGAHFGESFGNGRYVMNQSTAFDPRLSFIFAYQLSGGGRSLSAWGTYTNGQYTKFIAQVQPYTGFGGVNNSQGSTLPAYSGQPWYSYPMYADSDGGFSNYHNTDVGTPTDTPITAPLPGTITYLGYFDWGGQVSWRVDNSAITLGVPNIFVIHLDAINPNLKVGQHIQAGTFLGYSGGQLSSQGLPPLPDGLMHHNTSAAHTTGPHLDIGVSDSPTASLDVNQAASNAVVQYAKSNAIPYGTGIGTSGGTLPVGSTVGGTNEQALQQGLLPVGFSMGRTVSFDQLAQNVHNTLVQNPGFAGIALALDKAEQFPGVYSAFQWTDSVNPLAAASDTWQSIVGTVVGNALPFMIRSLFIIVGLCMVMMLLWQLVKPAAEMAPQLLALGALA